MKGQWSKNRKAKRVEQHWFLNKKSSYILPLNNIELKCLCNFTIWLFHDSLFINLRLVYACIFIFRKTIAFSVLAFPVVVLSVVEVDLDVSNYRKLKRKNENY